MDTTTLEPAVLYILLALSDRESHGYGIMQSVREQSGFSTRSVFRVLSDQEPST